MIAVWVVIIASSGGSVSSDDALLSIYESVALDSPGTDGRRGTP